VPVAFVHEFAIQGDDRSTTNYDAMKERLRSSDVPAEGLIFHSAGFDVDAGVFRIYDVWDSQEHAVQFQQQMMEIAREVLPEDASPPDREVCYELHDVALDARAGLVGTSDALGLLGR
jgi:hypothetical protein